MTRPDMTTQQMRDAADASWANARRVCADPRASHAARCQAAREAQADSDQWENAARRGMAA